MKKIMFLICVFAVATIFSFTAASSVFAGPQNQSVQNLSHTITIVNNSNTPLVSAGSSFQKGNFGNLAACGTDACPAENSLTVNDSTIPANGKGTVTMTGPAGCRVMGFMSYWSPDLKGKNGQIQCSKSWTGMCNSAMGNVTCTISQTNVDTVKGNGNAATPAESVQ